MESGDFFSLAGKRALVVGASRGIGLAIGRAVAHAGADTILASRSLDVLETHAAELCAQALRARALRLDLTDPEAIRPAAEAAGDIDILLNVSGMNIRKPFVEYTREEVDRIFATNLRGICALTRIVGERMVARGRGGKIIFVGSSGALIGVPRLSIYSMTKGGLDALTRSLAAEWGRDNIQVNCIAPGFILTDLNRSMWQDEKMHAWLRASQAIPRMGTPEEVAPLAVFLAGAGSNYITGQVIACDGGYTTTAVWPFE